MDHLRTVGKQLLSTSTNTLAFLFSKTKDGLIFVLGASTDLAVDLRPLLKEVFAKFGGKGGGDGRFVQGNIGGSDLGAVDGFIVEKLKELQLVPK